ncbi:MAG TPA: hypothetical protein VHW66_22245 [Stellaceae bacterium]|jgi:hypothetical protein|nr:hypothetical protein [Stellaceae bacterium]
MFRLRDDATKWFADLAFGDKIGLKFEIFYFTMMAGFAAVRWVPFEGSAATDLIAYFPGDYVQRRHLLVAGLINAELVARGIRVDEKPAVQRVVSEVVTPFSNNGAGLSDYGVKRMNEYASGGFEVLRERMDKPRSVETFLRLYPRTIEEIEAERSDIDAHLSGAAVR